MDGRRLFGLCRGDDRLRNGLFGRKYGIDDGLWEVVLRLRRRVQRGRIVGM